MLTEMQLRFANEYLVDSNAHQAALRAGYALKTATANAYKMLEQPAIKAYIEERRQHFLTQIHVTQERVLAEYARIAFANMRDLYDEDNNLLPVRKVHPDLAAAVVSAETTQLKSGNRVTKLRLSDKRAALDSICKMMGYFEPEKEENGLVINWIDNTGHK